ncbi:hypothetical protein DMN91_007973 [Ooceraea biroi]|uniref:Uncharacterized protein n=1 Tax=Ooceraea biroi TaxID=2015173 RepID=A0A3L8DGH8_OOCBI|nr:hypothetical protein DMN91_007973 [Ooceraea biroi]
MESLFMELWADDLDNLLPQMKRKLMSGTESAQLRTVEEIATFLKRAEGASRGSIVRKLVKFSVISTLCDVQTAEESFIRITLECFELMSNHKEFYEDYTALCATESMLRLSYCINKSLTHSRLLEELLQGVCNVLVRSSKFAVNFDAVCVPRRVVLFLKNLNIQESSRNKLRFTAVTMLNVVLQRAVFENEDDADAKLIIDVCRDALKSMADIVKYDSDDGNTILHAVALLCGTCDGVSRFCNIGADGDDQTDAKLEVCQTKVDLSDCVYGTVMNVIVPYVKEADLSRVDPIEFHRSLVSCLNNLYRQRNCNHDDLSNHLAANGYLKYFLCLTVRLP